MTKDGKTISKFSKEAMGLGKDVYDEEGTAPIVLKKVTFYTTSTSDLTLCSQ